MLDTSRKAERSLDIVRMDAITQDKIVRLKRDSHGDDQDPFRIMNGMEGGSYGILRYFLDQNFRVDRSISKRFFELNQGNLFPRTGTLYNIPLPQSSATDRSTYLFLWKSWRTNHIQPSKKPFF